MIFATKFSFVLFIGVALMLFLVSDTSANSPGFSPISESHFSIERVQSSPTKFQVFFEAEPSVSGKVNIKLVLPDGLNFIGGDEMDSSEWYLAGVKNYREWVIEGSGSGIHMLQVNFSFSDIQNPTPVATSSFHCVTHYIELQSGLLVDDFKIVPHKWLTTDASTFKNENLGTVTAVDPIIFDNNTVKIKETYNKDTELYAISIYVAGRLMYDHGQTCFPSTHLGIPGHTLWLEWDSDHNPDTGYWPYDHLNERHIYFDETTDDGSYYFSFVFYTSHPANYYSDQLRVYACRSNDAAYSGNHPAADSFPVMGYIDISSATETIYSPNVHLTQDANHGAALRGLYHAFLFSSEELAYETGHKIRYYIDFSCSSSFYEHDGDNGDSCGPDPEVCYILFNMYPDGPLTAHEYGHHIDHIYNSIVPHTNAGVHYFALETDYETAWVEGWAEFFGASSMIHQYRKVLDGYFDGTNYAGLYTFLEYDEKELVYLNANKYKVEGAVASMLHACWDDAETRSLGYSGDNEEVEISGSIILSAFNQAEVMSPPSLLVTQLLSKLQAQQPPEMAPVLHKLKTYYFDNPAYPPTSRGPSFSWVTGTSCERTISWEDQTSPSSVTLNGKYINCQRTFEPHLNNETEFRIYCRNGSSSWDGTLAGFTLR